MDVVARHRKAVTAALLAAVGLLNAYFGINITLPQWLVDAGRLAGLDLSVSGIVNMLVLVLIPVAVQQVPNKPPEDSATAVSAGQAATVDVAGNPNAGGG